MSGKIIQGNRGFGYEAYHIDNLWYGIAWNWKTKNIKYTTKCIYKSYAEAIQVTKDWIKQQLDVET